MKKKVPGGKGLDAAAKWKFGEAKDYWAKDIDKARGADNSDESTPEEEPAE